MICLPTVMDAMNVCRLCLKMLPEDSVFLILNENEQLVDLIFQFLQIEIFPDSLEDYYLCDECHTILLEFNKFKDKCNTNDSEFRTRYQFKQDQIKAEGDVLQTQTSHDSKDQPLRNETDDSTQFYPKSGLPMKPTSADPEITDNPIKFSKTKSAYVRDRRKLPCHVCGKLVSNAAYTVHVALHNATTERFECQICNRSYRQKHNLTKHLNTHTKKVLFPCEVENCGKVFDVASTLRKHFKIMHTDIRDHECTLCDRKFAIASGLRGHMRTKHCTEKIHGCSECGKMFKTPGEVKLHLRIHTKRHPYVCPECNEAFPKASILKEHRANKHNFPNTSVLDME